MPKKPIRADAPGAIDLVVGGLWYRNHVPGPPDSGDFDNLSGYELRIVEIKTKPKRGLPYVTMIISGNHFDPPKVYLSEVPANQRKYYDDRNNFRYKTGTTFEVPASLCLDKYFRSPIPYYTWRDDMTLEEKRQEGFRV